MIKKFEIYKIDYDKDLAKEYAKFILSKYLDNKEGYDPYQLQNIFLDVIKGDDLEEHQDIIINEIKTLQEDIYLGTQNLKTILEDKIGKYKL